MKLRLPRVMVRASVRWCLPRKLVLLALVLAADALSAAEPFDVGEAFRDSSFWGSDPVLFVTRHRENGFKFTSDDRTMSDSRLDGGVSCFGVPVYETRVAFGATGGIDRVELMLFNRGGMERIEELNTADGNRVRRLTRTERPLTRDEFFAILKTMRTRLTSPGVKPPPTVDARTKSSRIRQREQTWPVSDVSTVASLLWNYSQDGKKAETFQPGFIRLSVDGPSRTAQAGTGRKSAAKPTAKGTRKIVENVVRDSRGDVFIDNVPMVDQGMKGYCAVSAAERVMRYYGIDVDEHEIAEAAGTRADSGTSTRAMKDAVAAIGRRYRLAVSVLYGDFDENVDTRIANLGTEVANYNKMAKRLKKKPITEDMYVSRHGNVISYDVAAVDAAMDPEVLKEMKTKGAQSSKYTKFKRHVRQNVDAGMPLFWGVMLGTYPETDLPQAKGGHMRLIIGYNEKKNEIIYTDTWGKGHELKRMPMDWAWTISRCLMAMKPIASR